MEVDLKVEISALNEAISKYKELSRRSWDDVLKKQGGKLGFALRQNLRGLSPAAGAIRAERLSKLRSGEGIKVRESVRRAIYAKYGARTSIEDKKVRFQVGTKRVKIVGSKIIKKKRLNLQALAVQREIGVRESGRGFLSISSRYPKTLRNTSFARNRFGVELSKAEISVSETDGKLEFTWDGARNKSEASAAQGLNRPAGRAIIARAIRETRDDVMEYVRRKIEERAQQAGFPTA
jgi:hypothetical protein